AGSGCGNQFQELWENFNKPGDTLIRHIKCRKRVSLDLNVRHFAYSDFNEIEAISRGFHGTIFSAKYFGEKDILKKHNNTTDIKGYKALFKE
ncbi:3199_t:CDS:2, partial [Gigaspora margarita]